MRFEWDHGRAIEHAATTVTNGSALVRSRSAEIQGHRDLSSSNGEDATLQLKTDNVVDGTDAVFRRYAGANA